MKEFTTKEVFILVFAIVSGTAFLETSSPVWTADFWREFLVKLLIYGVVSEFIVLALGTFSMWTNKRDEIRIKRNEVKH